MKKTASGSPTRRDIVRGIGAAGLGAAVSAPLAPRAFAQARKPVSISFWTFDNPQQRPWVHKRVKMFMEQNPHVKVDFQWFAFGDLGKKISVGFATGTAPDAWKSRFDHYVSVFQPVLDPDRPPVNYKCLFAEREEIRKMKAGDD